MARGLNGPLQRSDHQLLLCQHQGGPGGNMVLGFELWPLVEEERRHVKRCQRALGFFFPAAAVAKAALFTMTCKAMTCCRVIPSYLTVGRSGACWRRATAELQQSDATLLPRRINLEGLWSPARCRSALLLPRSHQTWLLDSQDVKGYCGSTAEYTVLALSPQRT